MTGSIKRLGRNLVRGHGYHGVTGYMIFSAAGTVSFHDFPIAERECCIVVLGSFSNGKLYRTVNKIRRISRPVCRNRRVVHHVDIIYLIQHINPVQIVNIDRPFRVNIQNTPDIVVLTVVITVLFPGRTILIRIIRQGTDNY